MESKSHKLAVLMPVFNGGEIFLRSVISCAGSGLAPDEYELIVVDNCSTDGIPEGLPPFDPQGAPIRVYRNEANLGRVGNWNRAVDIAVAEGFEFVTFLFVGDVWLPNGSLPRLLAVMRRHHALIGFSSFRSIGPEDDLRLHWAPLPVSSESVITSTGEIAARLLGCAHFPLGPIQANIYRLASAADLRFEPERSRTTDVDATADFLFQQDGAAVIVRDPFFAWRERSDRFQYTMDIEVQLSDKIDIFKRAVSRCGSIRVNSRRSLAYLLLVLLKMAGNEARGWGLLKIRLRTILSMFRDENRPSAYWLARALYEKLILRRRFLYFENGA
jgi:glycosyltransferase involved in cell wall biosynthesis